MHYSSLTGKYHFLCFMIEPCFVSMCPKMLLLVRTGHTKVTSKAGNTDRQTDRRVIENETATHLLQYYKRNGQQAYCRKQKPAMCNIILKINSFHSK